MGREDTVSEIVLSHLSPSLISFCLAVLMRHVEILLTASDTTTRLIFLGFLLEKESY
jgi:hypothetical protein